MQIDVELNVNIDDELIRFKKSTIEVEEYYTVRMDVDIESDGFPFKGFNPYGVEWTLENGETVWIATHNTDNGSYCEECGRSLPIDVDFEEEGLTFRGEVWRRDIAEHDPVIRPMYTFCSAACLERFKATTMQRRYGDAPPKIEVQLDYQAYDRFARVYVDGVEIYTVQASESIFNHNPGNIPFLSIDIPLVEYEIKGRVMGPENTS